MFREENFGPVAGLTRFDSESGSDPARQRYARAGLAAYFYTRDVNRSWRIGEALEYGMVGLNTGRSSMARGPFGGIKESGHGP